MFGGNITLIANKGTVYTNGTTLDINKDSAGSVYAYFAGTKVEKDSPKITTEIPYDIVLHTNGGIIKKGREVSRYFAGEVTALPDEFDMTYSGYDFVGWYDNEGLTGTPITEITPTDSGNKEYWAKWEKITITIRNAQESIYIAVGYDDLYKVGEIVACLQEVTGMNVQTYITRGMSKTSKRLTDIREIAPYSTTYFTLPRELFEEIIEDKEDTFVYLHYLWGTNQVTVKIRLRVSVAFVQH